MKRLISFAFLSIALLLTSCYDDSEILDKLSDHEARIAQLEELCREMNTNITSLQSLVNVLQNNDYATAIVPVEKDGETIGYTISFSKSKSITIYHGEDGNDGKDGKDGKDGADASAPVIGVRMSSDGLYYWTLNGEWMLDDDGNKIPATGPSGATGPAGESGSDGKPGITPMLTIEDGFWMISYDNGESWKQLGQATGEAGEPGDSIFQDVEFDSHFIYFTFKDGSQITVPIEQEFTLTLSSYELVYSPCKTHTVYYAVTGGCDDLKISAISDVGYTIVVNNFDGSTGEIVIEPGEHATTGNVIVLANSGTKTVMQTISVTYAEVSFIPTACSASYAEFDVAMDEDIKYIFYMPLVLNKSSYDGIYHNAMHYMEGTDKDRAELIDQLRDYGWVIANGTNGKDQFECKRTHMDLQPDTDYVVAYCGVDFDGEIKGLYFSKIFRTKPMTWASRNMADLELLVSDITDSKFIVQFTYDPDQTAVVRFVVAASVLGEDYDTFPGKYASQADLKEWIQTVEYMHVWQKLESGVDSTPFSGFLPRSEVIIAYYSEDMNGDLSNIMVETFTTLAN